MNPKKRPGLTEEEIEAITNMLDAIYAAKTKKHWRDQLDNIRRKGYRVPRRLYTLLRHYGIDHLLTAEELALETTAPGKVPGWACPEETEPTAEMLRPRPVP